MGTQAVAPGTAISQMLDVMGMSHQPRSTLSTWHTAEPGKLVVATEVSSCALDVDVGGVAVNPSLSP